MTTKQIIDRLPKYLSNYIVEQHYEDYTDQDHAVWRYVMKRNINFLTGTAHESFLQGLLQSGINAERIPRIDAMNAILQRIGWAAVCVDGFIPPASFMAFQAHQILVIAADIRSINHIEYTPAPDIIHEAAGHAPIIVDKEYADYLRLFGEIGTKAFSSVNNYKIYEAVRHLSILKADPNSPENDIQNAEEKLNVLLDVEEEPSEMTLIRNLHWWTVEYGLIGDLDNPKIYGAGLLSSIGESVSALKPDVKKIPYSLEAKDYSFDITTQQPQLFVTPDFKRLTEVLNEFVETMAYRRGGVFGMEKAVDSENVATCVYSSGLQVSGVFTEIIEENDQLVFLKTSGPTNLNYDDKELSGHNKEYHIHGFSSPVGFLKNSEVPLEEYTNDALIEASIIKENNVHLEFESGLKVKGFLQKVLRMERKIVVMTFKDCHVNYGDRILFEPEWGVYDMAVGAEIISVFSGPVDPDAFGLQFEPPVEKTHKIDYSDSERHLHELYGIVRKIRETKTEVGKLKTVFEEIKSAYPKEWLLPLEIFEILYWEGDGSLQGYVLNYLKKMKASNPEFSELISKGLNLILSD
jgi:phenylalanine-4-hydroxylase